jgi:hypothetical protein
MLNPLARRPGLTTSNALQTVGVSSASKAFHNSVDSSVDGWVIIHPQVRWGGVFFKLWCVATNHIPACLRANKDMTGESKVRIIIQAAKRNPMNVPVKDPAQGRATDFTELQASCFLIHI